MVDELPNEIEGQDYKKLGYDDDPMIIVRVQCLVILMEIIGIFYE